MLLGSETACSNPAQIIHKQMSLNNGFFPRKQPVFCCYDVLFDIFPANNQYSAAMKFYMEAGIVSSEFFANAVPKSIYDDPVYRKMMKCCSYLQCHTQVM